MVWRRTRTFLLMLFLGTSIAVGNSALAAEKALAEKLYNSANLHRNYAGWHSSMTGMLNNYQKALPEDVFLKLNRRFNLLSSEKRYKRRTLRALRTKLSDTEVRSLLQWYSDDGGELARKERLLSVETAPREPLNIWLQQQKITPQRQELLTSLMEATRAIDQGADFILQSALTMAGLVSQNMPDEQKLDTSLIQKKLTAQRPAIYKELENVSLARFAWTYQDVSDDMLKRYIAFAKTKDAQTWFEVLNQAQANMLLTGSTP